MLAATTALAATVTQAPTISGDPVAGDPTLTATTGAWTPAERDAPTYDWLRCDAAGANCAGITGACGRSYKVRHGRRGPHAARPAHGHRVRRAGARSADSEPDRGRRARAVLDPDRRRRATPVRRSRRPGPGKGTFTSGAQTGGGPEPPPDTTLAFIEPFPVIRIAGRFKGKRTTLTRVTVRTPARHAHPDPLQRAAAARIKRKAVAAKLISLRSLRRTYRPKATIEIRVTQAGKIGKYTRVRTRRGKAPVRLDRCLMPGKTKPVRCPAG